MERDTPSGLKKPDGRMELSRSTSTSPITLSFYTSMSDLIHRFLTSLMTPTEGVLVFSYLYITLLANTYHGYRTWRGR